MHTWLSYCKAERCENDEQLQKYIENVDGSVNMINIKCPNLTCPFASQVPDNYLGKKVVCKSCKTTFTIGSNGVRQKSSSKVVAVPVRTSQAKKTPVDGQTAKPGSVTVFYRWIIGLCLGALVISLACCCLIGVGFYYFSPEAVRKPEIYGGIEITSSEVRVVVYEFFADRELGYNYRSVDPIPNVASKIITKQSTLLNKDGDIDRDGFDKTVAEIAAQYKALKTNHSLDSDHIVISAGPGVFKKLEKSTKQNSQDKLVQAVNKATGGNPMIIVNESREVDLQIRSMIPNRYKKQTVVIDIGSSGCRGGCIEADSDQLLTFQAPGVKLVKEIVETRAATDFGWIKDDNGNNNRDKFEKACRASIDDAFKKPLLKELGKLDTNQRELLGRKRIEIYGGVPFVVATYKNPADRDKTRRPLSADSIDDFHKALREAKDFPPLDLSSVADEQLRAALLADHDAMLRNRNLSPEAIIVGTEMLRVLSEQLRFHDKDREVFFNNHGLYAMILGLMQENWENGESKQRGKK
jgi:hypothetical protein